MKALVWHGKGDVRIDNVKDPEIVAPTDVIIRVTATAICGSDLHLLDGYQPTMEKGDVLGHEPMGAGWLYQGGADAIIAFASRTVGSAFTPTLPANAPVNAGQ